MSEAKKLIVVGDGMVGKTALLNSFVDGEFQSDYTPTIFETSAKEFDVNGKQVTLGLWDTGGQEEFDKIRILAYPGARVVLMCYSVNNRTSLENILLTWYPEMKLHCPGVPLILVGCKSDTRTGEPSKSAWDDDFVDPADAKRVRTEIGAIAHVECSAKTHSNVDAIFEMAAEVVLQEDLNRNKPSLVCCFSKLFRRRGRYDD